MKRKECSGFARKAFRRGVWLVAGSVFFVSFVPFRSNLIEFEIGGFFLFEKSLEGGAFGGGEVGAPDGVAAFAGGGDSSAGDGAGGY